jgi:hypothetical protein
MTLRCPLFRQFIFALLVSGCTGLTVDDGMFFVTGQLSSPAGDCETYLLSESGTLVPNTQRAIREQRFSEEFIVAPKQEKYQVVVRCAGVVKIIAPIPYGTTIDPGKEVPIGNISL